MMYLFSLSDVKKAAKEAIINAWRFLNGQLDAIAYKLLSSIYDFFKQLSEIYLYNEEIMKVIGQRIGIILGIFILFRLAVSIISYIINPDKIADSSKGTKKIITNIFLSLTLLATVNIIFKEAYLIQKKVVSSQVIEKIFFGNSSNVEKIDISFYLYSAFLQIDIQGCEPNEIYNTETAISDNCDAAIVNAGSSISDLITKEIMKKRNLRPVLAKFDNINATYKGEYVFEYTPIISLVCAVIAILILLSSCLDIATRTIKLLFLQIIAPVPIALNMAPGKGEETFKKWYKECINTYLSLFIRIAVISFAIFMISLLRTNFSSIFEGRNTFIQVLLIIGCLMFAKQMPKLLENIFGIKMEGMVLNPIKKFQNEALLGKQITGLGAAGLAGTAAIGANTVKRVGGTAGDIKSTYNAFKNDGFKEGMKSLGTVFYGIGSIPAGGISAATRGTVGAIKGEKFGQIYSNAYKGAIDARNARSDKIDDKVWPWQEMASSVTHKLGGNTLNDKVKVTNDNLQKLQNVYKTMMSSLEGGDDEENSIKGTGSFTGMSFNGIKGLTKFEEELKKTTIDKDSFRQQASSNIAEKYGRVISENQVQEEMNRLYNEALANQQKKLDEIDKMKKERLDGIAKGNIKMTAAKRGTQNAITQGYEQMKELVEDINKATRQIDKNITFITEDGKASLMNGLSKSVSSELVTNKAAVHAEKVDKYAAKNSKK